MIWDKVVFQGIRAKVGLDQLRFMITGSAPITDDCMIALRVIFGCPVIQGLGLSETAGGICCSFMYDTATLGHCGGIICCADTCRYPGIADVGKFFLHCNRKITKM